MGMRPDKYLARLVYRYFSARLSIGKADNILDHDIRSYHFQVEGKDFYIYVLDGKFATLPLSGPEHRDTYAVLSKIVGDFDSGGGKYEFIPLEDYEAVIKKIAPFYPNPPQEGGMDRQGLWIGANHPNSIIYIRMYYDPTRRRMFPSICATHDRGCIHFPELEVKTRLDAKGIRELVRELENHFFYGQAPLGLGNVFWDSWFTIYIKEMNECLAKELQTLGFRVPPVFTPSAGYYIIPASIIKEWIADPSRAKELSKQVASLIKLALDRCHG